MTIWRTRIACWIPKAINTVRIYNNFLLSHCNNSCTERASVLRYKYMVCLVCHRRRQADSLLVSLQCQRHLLFFLNNQLDALIIEIYSVIKLYMFRASYLPIIRSFLLYIQH
jgi:hypothetical protein